MTLARKLQPGSPEQIRRDELLAIVNDPGRSDEERYQAALESMPLCYQRLAMVVPGPISDCEPNYEFDDDYTIMTKLLAMQGLAVKPLQ